MKYVVYSILLFFTSWSFAQVKDSLRAEPSELNDSIISQTILIEEVVISRTKLDYESKKQFLILQNRVYKVYPFAKTAAERLTALTNNMDKLDNSKDKRKYFKIVEDYINNEFKEKLKKLSRKQGQILIKLIYRQTGKTTYELIKDYKSGWKAFWANNAASLFDLDLKKKYQPTDVNEDYLIETILNRAFSRGRLVGQAAANPIELEQLNAIWETKATQQTLKN
jgi:hypothetical protein